MSAAKACPGHFLPKKCLRTRPLRECGNRKRENIVLIEVDSDDFGDVIILDVPDSFRKKFRKRPKHVISIDDDDDDNTSESRNAACKSNGDATTSGRCSPTSVAHSLNSAEVDVDSASEENTPVKLSKSKRTYSGTNVSRNRYGLSSDGTCSSDDDSSDCEFMGKSGGWFYEQWEKAPTNQPDGSSCGFYENEATSSVPNPPVHNSTEDVTFGDVEPPCQQSNPTSCSLNHDTDAEGGLADSAQKFSKRNKFFQREYEPTEMSEQFKRKSDSSEGCSDLDDKVRASVPGYPVHQTEKQNATEFSEPSSSKWCFDHGNQESFNDSAKELAGQCNSTGQHDDVEMVDVSVRDIPAIIKESSNPGVESTCSSLSERGQGAGTPSSLLKGDSCTGHEAHDTETNSSNDQGCIITDRQKLKETDEYKRAMEEEWASRQQQLQLQAEEVRRLRNRKRAEKMRIKANEMRQMQRLEEIRETRRKDEENINLKEQIRVGIRKELRIIETRCGDMSSLLRSLGIQIGALCPSPNEIQAAYKRACLKFHPDRFAKGDLRQQVEAEEKFKLISNMKDKLVFR